MRRTWAAGGMAASLSFSQYCITIEMQAAPHPLACCRTKGTFSHSPAPAARAPDNITASNAGITHKPGRRTHRMALVDRDQNNDGSTNSNQDVSDLLIVQSAGGKILLRLVGP